MNDNPIFKAPRLPATLVSSEVASLLGVQEYSIPVLVRTKLLKPLGNPSQNSTKRFCTAEILELAQSRDFLDKVARAIAKHFQEKNRKAKLKREMAAA